MSATTLSTKAENAGNPFKRALAKATTEELKLLEEGIGKLQKALPTGGVMYSVGVSQLLWISEELTKRSSVTDATFVSDPDTVEMIAALLAYVQSDIDKLGVPGASFAVSAAGRFSVSFQRTHSAIFAFRGESFTETLGRARNSLHQNVIGDLKKPPPKVSGWTIETAVRIERLLALAEYGALPAKFSWRRCPSNSYGSQHLNAQFAHDKRNTFDKLKGEQIPQETVDAMLDQVESFAGISS